MKTASESKAKAAGPMTVFETRYGAVTHFPESADGLTFLVLPGQEPLRVRGNLKRLLLTMIRAVDETQREARVLRRGLQGGRN